MNYIPNHNSQSDSALCSPYFIHKTSQ